MLRINIKFILLTIASYIFAVIQGGNLPYSVFYAFFIILIISFIYILLKQKNIGIKIKFNKKAYEVREEYEFTTIVKNRGFLPVPYIIINNKTLAKLNTRYNGHAFWLNSGGDKVINSKVRFHQRGIYNFGEIVLSISDLFNIFQRNKNINIYADVKVYPKIYKLKRFASDGRDIFKNTINKRTSLEDLYNIREVRKYNEGDDLKRVNWKVSAKHGELYVKNLETVSGEESNIFLDMSKFNLLMDEYGSGEENIIDLCISIINYMIIKHIKTKLLINTAMPRVFEIENREDFNELLEFIITQKSDGEYALEKYIDDNLDKMHRLSWIGIVTAEIKKELKDKLILLKDRGYSITVFYFANGLKDFSNIQILKSTGIACFSFNEIIKNEK